METIKVDALVVGGGAGGFGAVYRLAKNKKKVAVVDRFDDFGGTAVFSGVNCYEPGVSSPGVHRKLAKILQKSGDAWVCKFVPNINVKNLNKDDEYNLDWEKHNLAIRPFVVSTGFSKEKYSSTEKRCYITNNQGRFYRRFTFKPKAMVEAMNTILSPYSKYVTRFFNGKFVSLEKDGQRIKSVTINCKGKEYKIIADYFIDSTSDAVLARDFGIEVSLGAEKKAVYNEASAKCRCKFSVNGVSLIFVIKKTDDENFITKIPSQYKDIDISLWKEKFLYKNKIKAFFNVYPDLSINVNMLPTMDGADYFELNDKAKEVCLARLYAFWNYLQTKKGLKGFDIVHIFEEVGVRESYRVKGKYLLTENDVRKGFLHQDKKEEIIAYSDHALDVHGKNALGAEIDFPFGIPLSCTELNECKNLYIASKCISLSHIAGSSARLTRTIMAIGEGVGEAVALRLNKKPINYKKLRHSLKLNKYERFLLKEKSIAEKE